MSAIDLALWEVKGKALAVLVYELIGGKVRDRVSLYANGWFTRDRPSEHGPREGAACEEEWFAMHAKVGVAQGYRCLKRYPFSGTPQVITAECMKHGIGIVRARCGKLERSQARRVPRPRGSQTARGVLTPQRE